MVLAFAAVVVHVAVERRPVPLPPWLLVAATGFGFAALLVLVVPPSSELLNPALIDQRRQLNEAGQIVELGTRSDLAALVKFELALLLIPLMLATVGTTHQRIARLLDLWTISALVCALVAIVDYSGFHIAPTPIIGSRSSGLTIHPNYLALVCAMALPTALLWIARPGRWRPAGFAAVALLLGGELASGSRAGSVAIVLGLVVTVAAIPRLRRSFGVVAPAVGMILIAALLFTTTADDVIDQVRLGSDSGAAGSEYQRERAFDVAVDQFAARPLQGVGLAAIQDAHNIYIQLLAAGGLIAFAAFLVFVAGLWSSLRRASHGPGRDAALAAAVAVFVWLVNGVFDSQLADKYLYVVPGLLIAMACVAPARLSAADPAGPQAISRVRSGAPAQAGAG